jgi:hypothetical protein
VIAGLSKLRQRFVYRRTGPSILVAEGLLNTKGQAVVSRSKTGAKRVRAVAIDYGDRLK